MSSQLSERSIDFSKSVFLTSSNVRANAHRLNWRSEVLLSRYADAFKDKKVLDLASHDGRFMHAALAHGASKVVGVEVRADHAISAQKNLAQGGHSSDSYEVICADLVEYLKSVEPGAFDTILCFGVLSHLIEHIEIMREVSRIAPGTFILDTWVALEQWNLRERLRNYRVNSFVTRTQQGGTRGNGLMGRVQRWLRNVVPSAHSRTGNLVFLYEDAQAPGATVRPSGLMGWANPSLVEMLFDHFGLEHERVNWKAQGITDWTELDDYKRGARESWVARTPRKDDALKAVPGAQ